jgi:acetyl esterase/lipase
MFHAGGFVLGSTNMIPKTQIAALVEKGFIVVTPEYRLCPQVSLYDGPVQDAKDVLAWCQEKLPTLLKNLQVDSKIVVAMGHSAGGLLALTTVCTTTSSA